MATNWYTRLLKNIIGRTSKDVSSKSELRIKRLEDRRLLNAEFALIDGDLVLQNFDGTTTDLTISEGMDDLGDGDEAVYFFEINSSGVASWSEVGGTGLAPNDFDLSSGNRVLAVARDFFDGTNDLLINDTNDGSDVNISFANGGANVIDFIAGTTIGITAVGDITQGNDDDLQVSTLTLSNVGDVILDENGNDFTTFSATSRGLVTLTDANALIISGITSDSDAATDDDGATVPMAIDDDGSVTIITGGDVTVQGTGINTDVTVVPAENDSDISLTSGGAITLNAAVNAGTADVTLDAQGDITQNNMGIVTSTTLTISDANDVDLDAAANAVTNLNATVNGNIAYSDTDALIITGIVTDADATTDDDGGMPAMPIDDDGSVTIVAGGDLTVQGTGINTDVTVMPTAENDSDISLTSGGAIALNAAVDAGTADITMSAVGDITQNAAGILTARTLAITTANDVMLNNVMNDVVNLNAMTRGSFSYNDATALTIIGITSDIDDATDDDGGMPAMPLDDNGDIAVTAGGNLSVTGAISSVGANAGDMEDDDITLTTTGSGTVTIDAALTASDGSTASTGDVTINSASTVTINQAVSAQNVDITGNGNITQDAAGVISSNTLTAIQDSMVAGSVTLDADNNVSILDGRNDFATGSFTFCNTSNLIIGGTGISTVDGNITITVDDATPMMDAFLIVNNSISSVGAMDGPDGMGTNDGDILLVADGAIAINNTVDAGFIAGMETGDVQINSGSSINIQDDIDGNNVRLQANGDIFQGVGDIITANALAARQVGMTYAAANELNAADMLYNIQLGEDNVVSTFAASNAFEDGFINFRSTQNLTIGSLAAVAAAGKNPGFAVTTGVSTTDADAMVQGSANITIDAGGSLFLDEAVNATSTADVRLSANGDITQDGEGIITARNLGVRQNNAAAPGMMDPAELGTPDMLFTVDLCEANVVGGFAANNASAGGAVLFRSTQNLNLVNVGLLMDQNINFVATNGVTTNNGDIELQSDMTLAIDGTLINANGGDVVLVGSPVNLIGALNVGAGDLFIDSNGVLIVDHALTSTETIRLRADGDITQTAIITAASLAVQQIATAIPGGDPNMTDTDMNSRYDIVLGLDNEVSNFAASNAFRSGEVEFMSVRNLTIGADAGVTGMKSSMAATNGITTVDGAITVQTDNTAAMMDNTLTVNNAISSVGTMDGPDAMGTNDGNILLIADGAVTINATVDAGFIAGMTTGDIQINSGSSLNIQDDIDGNNVRLQANGDIFQGNNDVITANALAVRQAGTTYAAANELNTADNLYNIQLGENNVVSTFAATNDFEDGFINFRSTQNLTVGSLAAVTAAGKNPGFGATTGVSTTDIDGTTNGSANITIDAGGSLLLDEAVNATSTADVRLIGNGDISQDAEGIITARNLGVRQNNTAIPGMMDSAELGIPDMLFTVDLCEANIITGFAASNASRGGAIQIRSTQDLNVTSLAQLMDQNINFVETNGITTVDGAITVQTDNSLTVNNAISSVGAMDGPDAIGSNDGDILLIADGAVTIGASIDAGFDAGMETGDVQIHSGSFINIQNDIDGNNVRLQASGEIIQGDGDIITANALAARQVGTVYDAADDVDPDSANSTFDIVLGLDNVVSQFAAFNAFDGGQITFHTTENLTIGSLDAVTAAGKNPGFALTTGVTTTLQLLGNLDLDNDGDGTFNNTDNSLGDILIDSEQSLSIDEAIRAGDLNFFGNGANADVRLVASGDIRQGVNGTITAGELGVRQIADMFSAGADVSGNGNFDIDLLSENDVLLVTLSNAIAEGNINFRDTNSLEINAMTGSNIQNADFDQTIGIVANGGDIFVEAETDLLVYGVTANSREIISTDGVVDSSNMAPAPQGESITLQTVSGDIIIGQNVIITTDEDTADLASSPTTNDSIVIRAGETNNRTVTIQDGVQIRTDGGVAIDFADRPTAAGSNGNSAFFQGGASPIAATLAPKSLDGGLTTQASFTVGIGVAGEENLRVDIDWQDANDNDIVIDPAKYPDLAGTANVINSNSQLIDFLATDDGNYTFGHVYSVFDVNDIVNTTGGTATVRFGVSHHESIGVFGNRIIQNGFDNTVGGGVISQTGGVASTDTFFSPGTAEFNFVNTPLPPVIDHDPAPEPNPAPPNPAPIIPDVPLQVTFVEPPVASRVGVSSQSFDYFQLRRNEGDAGYVIIDEQISEDNGESLLDPSELRKYVDDNNIPDEQDYELWLITTKVNNSGQSVTLERPILKFDISGGRPIPAIEDLPMEFPELRLEPIPLDGDAEPVENSEMNDADPESEAPENPAKAEDEQENVSLLEDEKLIQRLDGSHQASAIGVGSVLAVSSMNRKKSEDAGRRVRNVSLLSRIFGGHSSK